MRRFLVGLTLVATLSVLPTASPAATGDPVPVDRDCLRYVRGIDLQTTTIPQLQAAVQAGRLTSADLVEAYLARIQAYSHYDAIRALNPHAIQQAAIADARRRAGQSRSVLDGIPVLLKDNVGTDDMPTTA